MMAIKRITNGYIVTKVDHENGDYIDTRDGKQVFCATPDEVGACVVDTLKVQEAHPQLPRRGR